MHKKIVLELLIFGLGQRRFLGGGALPKPGYWLGL